MWKITRAIVLVLLAGTVLSLGIGAEISMPQQSGELRQTAPNVFLDCERRTCDLNYIRSEITFVNYMRDRETADVHVLVTRRRTGGGGQEYTLAFIGLKSYSGRDTTLKYFSKSTDTEDQIRVGLVNMLKQGLIPYVSDTPLAEFISISYDRRTSVKPEPVQDKWNFWVFNIGLRGNLNMETLSKRYNYSLSLSANRTTENLKFTFWVNGNYNERQYQINDTEKIISLSNRKMIYSTLIKSLDDHWSTGIFTSLYASTFDNADIYASIGPALEFNVFPYDVSTRRELRLQYRIVYNFRRYNEVTVLDKTQEHLVNQTFQVVLEIKEPWGSIGAELEGTNYLHDFSKNNFKFETGISFRVFRGLSFNISSEYSRVRDQLSLPKGGASKDEILLELKRLATDYDFRLQMGFNYRFGSIYSNVVNPRFGNR